MEDFFSRAQLTTNGAIRFPVLEYPSPGEIRLSSEKTIVSPLGASQFAGVESLRVHAHEIR